MPWAVRLHSAMEYLPDRTNFIVHQDAITCEFTRPCPSHTHDDWRPEVVISCYALARRRAPSRRPTIRRVRALRLRAHEVIRRREVQALAATAYEGGKQ
jgi:hypothetical protein